MAEADFRLMTEATGQRIAAALEALHLAMVTGVKGDTEQNYRHGDVSITPANIGAVAKSGDTMTGPLSIQSTLYSYNIEIIPPVGAGNGGYVDFAYNGEVIDYTSRIIETQRGVLDVNGVTFQNGNLTGKTNGYSWDIGTENTYSTWVPVLDNGTFKHRDLPAWLNSINTVSVDHGGTNATTWNGARENLGIIARLESVPFDSNGVGTINTPNGFTPFAAVLDQNWFITVHPSNKIFARLVTDYNTLIRDTTSTVVVLYAKLA